MSLNATYAPCPSCDSRIAEKCRTKQTGAITDTHGARRALVNAPGFDFLGSLTDSTVAREVITAARSGDRKAVKRAANYALMILDHLPFNDARYTRLDDARPDVLLNTNDPVLLEGLLDALKSFT